MSNGDKVQQARQRHGKPFAHEPGSGFKYHAAGATVLNRWVAERLRKPQRKRAGGTV